MQELWKARPEWFLFVPWGSPIPHHMVIVDSGCGFHQCIRYNLKELAENLAEGATH